MDFVIWIAGTDEALTGRWVRLFSRECMMASAVDDLGKVPPAEGRAMLFTEMGMKGLKKPADLAEFLQRNANFSVIVFSGGGRADNARIAEFLEAGADDFVQADIDERVLLCKAKAHIRRLLPALSCARTIVVSRSGDLEIDRLRRTVRTGIGSKNPAVLDGLTPKEFEILSLLICNEDRVVSRAVIMETIWREKSGKVNCETIDKHVETLRGKLGRWSRNIRTVYGAGYIYKTEV